jgi:serine/threonine protein kinase
MAEVYLARHRDRPGLFAVKVLHPKLQDRPENVEMFRSEGRVARLLRHEGIVRTHELGHAEGRWHLVMDHLSGMDLTAVVRGLVERGQRLLLEAALHISERVLGALHHAHDLQDPRGAALHLVNRDVSPTNIMVTWEGDVRVIDFGIAQTTLGFRSQIGRVRGKVAYMSPEQARGHAVDRRSDVFSVGVLLHELVTGDRLFRGQGDFALMEAVRSAPIPAPSTKNPRVDAALDAILARALDREVGGRYPSAEAFREALVTYREERLPAFGTADLAAFLAERFPEAKAEAADRCAAVLALPLPEEMRPEPPSGEAEPPPSPRRATAGGLSLASFIGLGLALGVAASALLYWIFLR